MMSMEKKQQEALKAYWRLKSKGCDLLICLATFYIFLKASKWMKSITVTLYTKNVLKVMEYEQTQHVEMNSHQDSNSYKNPW